MTSMDKEKRRKAMHHETPPVAPDGAAPPATRLELLYAIGKKLTRASDPEQLIPEVLSIAAAALSLRSAIVALRTNGATRLVAWPTRGAEIEDASNHALATFAYLLQEPALAAR